MPHSAEEFTKLQCSGNYHDLKKRFKPGALVTELAEGPILKPAMLLRVEKGYAYIQFTDYVEEEKDECEVEDKVKWSDILP
jgi:hypothetical protein